MIKKIEFAQYGKFKKTGFDLAPVTVITGKNEAGKSTLADALFDALTEPKNNTLHGRRLTNRYGERGKERFVDISFEGEKQIYDPDEFSNIFAIQAGDLEIKFAEGKNWLEKIKAQLFSGGLDPVKLGEDLRKRGEKKETLSHMKLLRKKEAELSQAREKLKNLEEKRRSILEGEREILKGTEELKKTEETIAASLKEKRNLENSLDQQGKIKEKAEHLKILKLINEYNDQEEDRKKLLPFQEIDQENLENLKKEIADLSEKIRDLDMQIRIQGSNLQKVKTDLSAQEREREKKNTLSSAARSLLLDIKRKDPQPKLKKVWSYNKIRILFGFLILFLSLALGIFLKETLLQYGAFGFGILGLTVFLLLSIKFKKEKDYSEIETYLELLKKEWQKLTSSAPPLVSQNLPDLERELSEYETDLRICETGINEKAEHSRELDLSINDLKEKKEQKELELKSTREKQESLFRRWGVRDETDLDTKKNLYKQAESQSIKLAGEISEYCRKFDCTDWKDLKALCGVKITELDQSILEKPLEEREIQILKNKLERVEETIRKNRENKEKLLAKVSEDRGSVKGSLRDLPDQILEQKKISEKLEAEIREIRIDMKAAEIAAEIFMDLAGDDNTMFQELSGDISRMFERITDPDRGVEFTRLDPSGIKVLDAEGRSITVSELSSGTRDAFMLAARLCLALKTGKNKAILVFDEPFITIDEEREKRALKLLESFRRERNWQLLIFSRDEKSGGLAQEIFGKDCRVINLNRVE